MKTFYRISTSPNPKTYNCNNPNQFRMAKKFNLLLIFALVLTVFVAGCVQEGTEAPETEPDQKLADSNRLVGSKWTGTIEIETINKNSPTHAFLYDSKQIDTGTFSFTISQEPPARARITGSGTAKSTFTQTGECLAEGSFTLGLLISGSVDPVTGKIILSINDDVLDRVATGGDYARVCQTPGLYGGRPQTTNTNIYTFFEESSGFELEPVSGASVEYSEPYYEGQTTYKVTITGGLSESFDFDVDVDPPIVTIKQGETAQATVTAKLLRGESQAIDLTVTDWSTAGITSWFNDPELTPTTGGVSTTLSIQTTCDTQVDDYLHTVQGAAGILSSVDSVNVKVIANDAC